MPDLPSAVSVAAISPETVIVTVTVRPTPTPSAEPTPTAVPSEPATEPPSAAP